jgi:hypothetical protein
MPTQIPTSFYSPRRGTDPDAVAAAWRHGYRAALGLGYFCQALETLHNGEPTIADRTRYFVAGLPRSTSDHEAETLASAFRRGQEAGFADGVLARRLGLSCPS